MERNFYEAKQYEIFNLDREQRIIEIIENIDFDAVRKFLDIISQTVNIEDDKNLKQILKLIDDLQELESTIKGIPIA